MTVTPQPAATGKAPRVRWRGAAVLAAVVFVVLLAALVLLNIRDRGEIFGVFDSASVTRQYLAVFLLIAADAVVPIFPGETTLNAASTLASQGKLELPLVMAAGALGAIVGDSCLYWIARRSSTLVAARLEQAKENEKVATALDVLEGRGGPFLLVIGRYVPGLRFVINATMGLASYPYPRFLLWSSIGGITWSIYTCALAYWIGGALADYPVASIAISGLVTTALLAVVYVIYRRRAGAAVSSG
jgi:membrane protein DedA with SNARE-associated domain